MKKAVRRNAGFTFFLAAVVMAIAVFSFCGNIQAEGGRGNLFPAITRQAAEEAGIDRNTQSPAYATSMYQSQSPLSNPAYNYYLNNSAYNNYSSPGADTSLSQVLLLNKQQELLDHYRQMSMEEENLLPKQEFIDPKADIPQEEFGSQASETEGQSRPKLQNYE